MNDHAPGGQFLRTGEITHSANVIPINHVVRGLHVHRSFVVETFQVSARLGEKRQLDSLAGHRRTHHGGSLPGFSAGIVRYPDDSLTVIVLTNADAVRADNIAFRVAELYLTATGRP